MKKTFKVVMLPTNQKANIHMTGIGLVYTINNHGQDIIYNNKQYLSVPQHLYILSDEEIKEGDWFISSPNYHKSRPERCTKAKGIEIYSIQSSEDGFLKASICTERQSCKKIVATTDTSILIEYSKNWKTPYSTGFPKIPESFIQEYIKAYNERKPITEVDLEMEESWVAGSSTYGHGDYTLNIKTRPDNTVIIHQSKVYTRDEVLNLINKYDEWSSVKKSNKEFKQWIQDNL